MQQSGSENRVTLHLPDGSEQIARDAQFKASASGNNPDKWSDRRTQEFLWGWDAEKAALDTWNGMFPYISGHHVLNCGQNIKDRSGPMRIYRRCRYDASPVHISDVATINQLESNEHNFRNVITSLYRRHEYTWTFKRKMGSFNSSHCIF